MALPSQHGGKIARSLPRTTYGSSSAASPCSARSSGNAASDPLAAAPGGPRRGEQGRSHHSATGAAPRAAHPSGLQGVKEVHRDVRRAGFGPSLGLAAGSSSCRDRSTANRTDHGGAQTSSLAPGGFLPGGRSQTARQWPSRLESVANRVALTAATTKTGVAVAKVRSPMGCDSRRPRSSSVPEPLPRTGDHIASSLCTTRVASGARSGRRRAARAGSRPSVRQALQESVQAR